MKCHIYKSSRRAETYVYLPVRDDFSMIPEMLRQHLGTLTFVLDIDLNPERRLALADPEAVISSIADKGYYLQLPPDRHAIQS